MLKKAQRAVNKIAPFMGGYWSSDKICLKMTEELGEFVQARRKYPNNITSELIDLLFAILCYANANKISLSEPLEELLNNISSKK